MDILIIDFICVKYEKTFSGTVLTIKVQSAQCLCLCCIDSIISLTVKLLNFWTPENFTVIYLKLEQRGQALRYFVKKMQME